MKATNLLGSKDMFMPGPADLRTEIDIQMMRKDKIDTAREYMSTHCNPDKTIKASHVLTPKEEAGKQEILEGIKTKDWILYHSDKS